MTICREERLVDFKFWSGAKETRKLITRDEMYLIEDALEEIYPDGINETLVNDIFWFETDFIAECLGYESYEDLYNERSGNAE